MSNEMSIQKKTLQHIIKTLGDIDSYAQYRAIQKALTDAQVSKDVEKSVMEAFNKSVNVEYAKAKEAKEWVEALLNDLDSKIK